MSNNKPTIEGFYQQIEEIFNQSLTIPAKYGAKDFWENWDELQNGILNKTINANVDILILAKNFPEYGNYHQWKGFGKIIIFIGVLLFFIHTISAFGTIALGLIINYYGNIVKAKDGKKFINKIFDGVTGSPNDKGMAELCSHFIAGTIQLSSGANSAHWPQYPSNVITGETNFIQT